MPSNNKSISNDRLASMSLDAAVELELLLLGQNAHEETVGLFLETLGESIPQDSGSISKLADPSAVAAYGKAMNEVYGGITTVSELAARLHEVKESFINSTSDHERLTHLKSFCLAVHHLALARSQELNNQIRAPHDGIRKISRLS